MTSKGEESGGRIVLGDNTCCGMIVIWVDHVPLFNWTPLHFTYLSIWPLVGPYFNSDLLKIRFGADLLEHKYGESRKMCVCSCASTLKHLEE